MEALCSVRRTAPTICRGGGPQCERRRGRAIRRTAAAPLATRRRAPSRPTSQVKPKAAGRRTLPARCRAQSHRRRQMDCNEARPLLDADADHELSPPLSLDVQRHIASCDACRRESEMVQAMKGAVRSATYHRAPDALRARIMASLPPTEAVQLDWTPRETENGAQ